MRKVIKKSHILIVGAAPSLKKYWKIINEFIKNNKVVTVGVNGINIFLIPNYHFWLDKKRYKRYGHRIDKRSKIIFGGSCGDSIINKWDGEYEVVRYSVLKKIKYRDVSNYYKENVRYDKKKDKFYGNFRTAGSLAILWSYIKKASKISVVGMDGYTFYSNEDLLSKAVGQHCYSRGFSDRKAAASKYRKLSKDEFYDHCIKKDADVYKTLRAIKKYGVKFEILTPTVYKDFYNPKILNIVE
jgi:hypothetical protein